jgi:endonuclease/exonuclease/phosphatase family metal-dependent hydrolase
MHGRMRIASLNAWGGAMFDQLADWVPRSGADVLCLQEVTRTPGLDGWTSFRDAERHLPQRANLFRDVGNLLPHHQAAFVASDAGPVADGDGDAHRQDFGLALFVDERLPVVGQAADFVHGTFTDHEDWPAGDRPRIAHGLRLLDRQAERTVAVVHLHGLRDPAGKHDTPARREQARRLVDLVERLRGPGDLTVICGDLNLLPDSETFAMLADIGLVDLVGTADTRTARYTKPLRHANYLLVSDPELVKHFETPATPEVSDHRPLILDI